MGQVILITILIIASCILCISTCRFIKALLYRDTDRKTRVCMILAVLILLGLAGVCGAVQGKKMLILSSKDNYENGKIAYGKGDYAQAYQCLSAVSPSDYVRYKEAQMMMEEAAGRYLDQLRSAVAITIQAGDIDGAQRLLDGARDIMPGVKAIEDIQIRIDKKRLDLAGKNGSCLSAASFKECPAERY